MNGPIEIPSEDEIPPGVWPHAWYPIHARYGSHVQNDWKHRPLALQEPKGGHHKGLPSNHFEGDGRSIPRLGYHRVQLHLVLMREPILPQKVDGGYHRLR